MSGFARRHLAPLALGASISLSTTTAYSDDGAAAAEALFVSARALVEQGKLAEACPKFEQSYAIEPALGTLLNLADCFERTERTASAWLRYREAAGAARVANEGERERIARERASRLEARLCKLTIDNRGRSAPEDLRLVRDGVKIDSRTFGIETPIDPGVHLIRITRGDRSEERSITITSPSDGTACTTQVFTLPDWAIEATSSAPSIDMKPKSPSVAPPPPVEDDVEGGFGVHHVIALATGGVGVIASAFGAGYGIDAIATQASAEELCRPEGCTSRGLAGLADAGQSADASTVFFIVGGALVTTGVILWLTSPSLDEPPRPSSALLHF